jgi:tRNA threonylcarbamoyladenosine biosynthesis protein TsaE
MSQQPFVYVLSNEAASLDFAKKIAQHLPEKAVIHLNGPLGAGKTTFVRGILLASGHQGSTKSPTYTLVEPYQITGKTFYHFDLYRLGDPEELEYIGIRDYFDEEAICLIEWPDKGQGYIAEPDLVINLSYQAESRSITLVASEKPWAQSLVKTFVN